ncbi:unnamed protein product [Bursaphelenchus okinawaensis]|uniref:DNA primase large subunit C-terminal domain-containing protein n=1 Tax=Bursaphelenchus okinawaensis TaxID=465554 RepID=A0A811JU84_9BILA|nr:unnamed protein product [Bursaphelenchus okinawaensis]CAG9083285.1 unnamed protein product [Bursaphelenchus okinawaensis]
MMFGTPSSHSTSISQFKTTNKLEFYRDPPSMELDQNELYDVLQERFQVLNILEQVKNKEKFLSPEFMEAFKRAIVNIQPLYFNDANSKKLEYYRRRDLLSHFLLRLVCCTDSGKQKWFADQECALLRVRIQNNGIESLKEEYFSSCRVPPVECSAEEIEELQYELAQSGFPEGHSTLYKVYFTDCRDLVAQRKALLKGGFCYVTNDDLANGIVQKFRIMLNQSMANQIRKMKDPESEDWIVPKMYKHLYPEAAVGTEIEGAQIQWQQINSLAYTSFPLCMRDMHEFMKLNKGLKHQGRLQYSLFIKGTGLSVEDSLAFFRTFCDTNSSKFKEFEYSIKHIYGLIGSKHAKRPYNCEAIIKGPAVSKDVCHGCPYKYLDEDGLAKKLDRLRVSESVKEQIISLKNEHRYDLACTKYFESSHKLNPGQLGCTITNPNDYLKYSLQYSNKAEK